MAKRKDDLYLMRFAGNFSVAINKIKEGSETPGCDIRLTHEECQALATGLHVIANESKEHKDA